MSVLLKDRYRIVQDLGSGGFGKTYIAEDEQLFHRRCVVKQLAPEDNSPETLEIAKRLFDQEAKTLHFLGQHQQIPELYAHFEDQQRFYLVQALIEGNTLDQDIGINPWVELEVILFLDDVLSTLSFVHQQGVIHRDIKPANLMRRCSDSKIVLIDFGAVKECIIQSQSRLINKTPTTLKTVAVGTPGYMPSEQAVGKPRFASDLYALGITAIQALTGNRCEEITENSRTGEIEWEHLVSISPGLEQILQKMVAYDFRQRFDSAATALEALGALLEPASTPIPYPPTKPSTVQPQSVFAPTPQTAQATSGSPIPLSQSKDWHLQKILKVHSSPIKSMACHPRQSLLITSSWDQSIKFWQLPAGQLLKTLKGDKAAINAVIFNPQGDQLASGGEDTKISLWQPNHNFPLAFLNGHNHWINCLTFSPDGGLLVSGSKDETVKIWQLNTGLVRQTFNIQSQVWTVAVSADQQFMACGSNDGLIRIWQLSTGQIHKTLRGHDAAVKFVAFHPNQPWLLSSSEDHRLTLWQYPTGQVIKSWRGDWGSINAVAVNPQWTLVATAGLDGKISLWQLPSGEKLQTLNHTHAILSLVFSPDGQNLYGGDLTGIVSAWV